MAKKNDSITPRDLFAAAALAGIMADRKHLEDEDAPNAWQWAFQLADAMMHQRSRPPCYVGDDGWVRGPEEDE